jgi:hypothetical protein
LAAAHIVGTGSTDGNLTTHARSAMLPMNTTQDSRASAHRKLGRAAIGIAMTAMAFSFTANAQVHDAPLWTRKPDACPVDALSYAVRDAVRDCMTVDVNPALLRLRDVDLRLELPDRTTVRASQRDAGPFAKDGFIWNGVVSTSPYSRVTFSMVDDVVVGTIVANGRMYRLRQAGSGTSVVENLDRALLPAEGRRTPPPLPPPPPSPTDTSPRWPTCFNPIDEFACKADPNCVACLTDKRCETDSPNRIDVLIVYTANALTAATSVEAMRAWVYYQVSETNRSYLESNLSQQIHLVHLSDVTYSESSNTKSLDDILKLCPIAVIDQAHQLRDQYHADAVVLITSWATSRISGLAKTMQEYHVGLQTIDSFEHCAFGVVDVGSLETADFSLAHELGHVMGAEHDPRDGAGAIRASSYGYADETPSSTTLGPCSSWMTIMVQPRPADPPSQGRPAYPAVCLNGCERIPKWSTPDYSGISHCNEPVGTATANNRDTLAATALTVANFRCGLETPGNVWMKDTWDDTGAEPDPTQDNEVMWKSPYIWVRNTQDPAPVYVKQHLHENPLQGQTNYVYVKLHNGGVATNGTLELWAADASTGLAWQANFSQIGSIPVANMPGNTTQILELPWTPTYSGHHCLVARWASASDPMATPETTSISLNTRANNNIVWRNVNIIELTASQQSASASMQVRNSEASQAAATIQIVPSDPNPEHSLFRYMDVDIKLDRALMAAWSQARFRGTGFKRTFGSLRITDPAGATLEGLSLKPGVPMNLTLILRRPRDRSFNGKFSIDVIQKHATHGGSRIVGGVSYEVRVAN